MAGPKRPRNETAPEQALGHALGTRRFAERDEDEIRHAGAGTPAERLHLAGDPRAFRLDAGDVRLEEVAVAERLGHHRDGDGADRAGRPVWLDALDQRAQSEGESDAEAG